MRLALRRREGACSAGWRRCTRASASTPTRRWAGSSTTSRSPASSTTRSSSTAPTTAPPARGRPNGSVNEGKFFNGFPDDDRGEPGDARSARLARDLQPLPDRLGDGVLDAVPDVQALHVSGRRLRPARDPLAEGDQRARRGPRAVPPLRPTSTRRSSRRAGSRCRRRVNGVEQSPLAGVSMAYSFDAAAAPTAQGDAVLRDVRDARDLAQGLEGGHRARADQRHEPLRRTTAGSSSTATSIARRRTTWPSSTRSG